MANDRFTAILFTSFAANKVGANEPKNQAKTGESQTLGKHEREDSARAGA